MHCQKNMDQDLQTYMKYVSDDKAEEQNEYDKKITLPPEHPLLARFQAKLKEQLQSNIERFKFELNELNIEIKKKTQERDALGVNVYESQQLVSKQQATIEEYESELKKINEERQELEKDMSEIKQKHEEKKKELSQINHKDLNLQQEISTANYMLSKMKEWEQDMQSEMTINKRIIEKSRKDKKLYSEEKRNLDFMIYKLMTEIFRIEQGLEQCNMQLISKEKEREELSDLIAQSNADQEALQAEHSRLMHSWNCVLVAIKHRDNNYFAAKTEYEKAKEDFRRVLKEIEIEKKLGVEEMEQNERLTQIKERINADIPNIKAKVDLESKKLAKVENQLATTQALLDQTIKDYEAAVAANKINNNELNSIRREMERQSSTKSELEEKILSVLQEQLSNDKVAQYMNKKIKEEREVNRHMEIHLASIENQNAQVLVEIEKEKAAIVNMQHYLDELDKEKQQKEVALGKIQNELHEDSNKIIRVSRNIDVLNKKLEELISRVGGTELSPDEIRIKTLEKQIAESEEHNKQLQIFWLRNQSYNVELSEKRQQQLIDINMIRKQILILDQKNLKLEDEMENLDTQERLMQRDIANIQIKIDKIYKETVKKRDLKEELDNKTTVTQNELSMDLKDMEVECIRLESESEDLEKEKEQVSKELLDINRTVLAWEKKFQMANETKKSFEAEKGAEGEMGAMQNEIHRMTVRYGQLKRAQEKLSQDLQFTLIRRESFWLKAESSEKRTTGKAKNRIVVQHKLQTLRDKIKKLQCQRKQVEEKIGVSFDLEKEMNEDIKYIDEQIDDFAKDTEAADKQIEQLQLKKEMSLDKLLFLQNQAKLKSNINKKSYKMLYSTVCVLESEYEKEIKRNAQLKIIVENLITDFPRQNGPFTRIQHLLKLVHE